MDGCLQNLARGVTGGVPWTFAWGPGFCFRIRFGAGDGFGGAAGRADQMVFFDDAGDAALCMLADNLRAELRGRNRRGAVRGVEVGDE